MKANKPLENWGTLSKGTTRKITSNELGFLNFLKPLMTAGLQLMKNVLVPLNTSVLIPLELTGPSPAMNAAIQKKIHGSG